MLETVEGSEQQSDTQLGIGLGRLRFKTSSETS